MIAARWVSRESIERANDTTRVEFWNRYDGDFTVEAANRALADYQRFYHQVRPHQTLELMKPDEYLRKNKDSPPSVSHVLNPSMYLKTYVGKCIIRQWSGQ